MPITLGISGRHRDAAAALAVDGRVVAAVTEDAVARVPGIGYALTGGFPAGAVDACLAAANLQAADIEQVAVVGEEGSGSHEDEAVISRVLKHASVQRVDAMRADAIQAAASAEAAGLVLVWSADPPAIATFTPGDSGVGQEETVPGGAELIGLARSLAASLGVSQIDPYRALDRLSVGSEPEFADDLAAAIEWRGEAGVHVDQDRLRGLMATLGEARGGKLSDASSLNERLQRARRGLAASFMCRMAQVVGEAASAAAEVRGAGQVTCGGTVFGNSRLNTELRGLLGDGVSLPVVPEAPGRALGAALAAASAGTRLPGLALGPAYSDSDIKRVLDNCRLDYVYEPDWARLNERVSKLLAQGKVIAWFQGAMTFGPRASGTRSVLCDASNRYARQNINEYLRLLPLDEPLPVVFAPSVAADCLAGPVPAPFPVVDAAVKPAWHESLASALDWRKYVRVQAANASQAPELCALLEAHHRRVGVPALIETNLAGPGEPVACSPRDAVRTVYSSSVDALVIGRFVLMKDHWLLRANVE